MTQPKSFNQVIGNVAAIERIKSAIAENSGLGGCVFFLQGETGNGKTMFADIIADLADGDVYRAECNNGDEVAKYMDEIKTHAKTPPLCGGLSRVYDTFPSGRSFQTRAGTTAQWLRSEIPSKEP